VSTRVILLVVALIAGVVTASAAGTGTINREYAGCLTEAAFDEFTTAAVRKDYRHIEALLNRVCFNLLGRQYSLVKLYWTVAEIRVYVGGSSIIPWVPIEAVHHR